MHEAGALRGAANRGRRGARGGAPPSLRPDCALFVDIDGTLLDIAPSPERVRVDPALATLLPAIGRRLDGALALITGRSITDAEHLFPSLRLPIAGLHGLERRRADGTIDRLHVVPPGLDWLRQELARFAARHRGLRLEDKGQTLALHYRQAPQLASHVHRTMRSHLASHVHRTMRPHLAAAGSRAPAWRLQPGKRVLELLPAASDKGLAVITFLREPPFTGRIPVYVGDDLSDEFGFAAVMRTGGWAVKVGSGPTAARYRLRNVAAVRRWLEDLLAGDAARRQGK